MRAFGSANFFRDETKFQFLKPYPGLSDKVYSIALTSSLPISAITALDMQLP